MQSKQMQSVLETLESRQLMSAAISAGVAAMLPSALGEVRSVGGTGNNVANPAWGSAGQPLLRLAPAAYADGVGVPAAADRPNARALSNAIFDHGDTAIPSDDNLSAYAYLWGQFIDHDLDLTNAAKPAELFSIPVPKGDALFDPAATGTKTIPLTRSAFADGTGVTSPRQQVNDITAYIDASMIYGSDAARASALRSFVGGKLLAGDGNLLPNNTMGLPNATLGGPPAASFVAGDVRANENVELTAIHTLFLREHNRRADQLATAHPDWTDEQLYQSARRVVIAEVQAITYNEFLPALLGKNAIRPYAGYKAGVNAGISNEFSTAAFRLGHSMLPDDVGFLDDAGNPVREELSLAQAFFNPAVVRETGIDPILKYLASSNAEQIDAKVVDGLRNFLFGPPGAGGLDLVSLNIQRGRDHGLADYNTTRGVLGLPRVTSFAQITSDPELAAALEQAYGSVDNVDLWVGGLAEDHVPGAAMGATFRRILVDQFTRTRDGDRFWHQGTLSREERRLTEGVRLADIIKANTSLRNVQPNVFVFNARVTGQVFDDGNGNGKADRGERGLAGRAVQLIDAGGAVVASATTDSSGRFVVGGLELGTYQVVASTPAGWQTTTTPASVNVVQGDLTRSSPIGQRRQSTTGSAPATGTTPVVTAAARTDAAPAARLIRPTPMPAPPPVAMSTRPVMSAGPRAVAASGPSLAEQVVSALGDRQMRRQ